jgi:LmbE family N-acetylglucosaminyl deacetylase
VARAQTTTSEETVRAGQVPAKEELPVPAAGDRILVIAPHPDDESVGAGGLLALAARAGATLRIVFATSGENNPWAQRAFERRLLLVTRDRIRFGVHREVEAATSLAHLGVAEDSAVFLRLADQGLTSLLLHDPAALVRRLATELAVFRPTLVIAPWAGDLHPDHSALAVATTMALTHHLAPGPPLLRALAYVVHNRPSRASGELALELDTDSLAAKSAAIGCHRSQLVWRGAFMRSFAAPAERFRCRIVPDCGGTAPIRGAGMRDGSLRVTVRPRLRLRAPGPRTLLILGGSAARPAFEVPVPLRTRRVSVRVSRTGETVGTAAFNGGPRGGEVTLPAGLLSGEAVAYLKLQRRFGFFDEGGWVVVRDREESR